jgi:N-acylneuraminate cytidylyltransferase
MANKRIALIPARKGSERFPGKNLLDLNGHPLIAYTIDCALRSQMFDRVVVSTNCQLTADVALKYGAEIPVLRPDGISLSKSPDIEWVSHMVDEVLMLDENDLIAILRPTNPLRKPETLAKAFKIFNSKPGTDSLRAVRPIKEHPSKMWRFSQLGEIFPFDSGINEETNAPNHSSPFQALEKLWIQDASLEITRVNTIRKYGNISGKRIAGFEMPTHEGFDINYPEDLQQIIMLSNANPEMIPSIRPRLNGI